MSYWFSSLFIDGIRYTQAVQALSESIVDTLHELQSCNAVHPTHVIAWQSLAIRIETTKQLFLYIGTQTAVDPWLLEQVRSALLKVDDPSFRRLLRPQASISALAPPPLPSEARLPAPVAIIEPQHLPRADKMIGREDTLQSMVDALCRRKWEVDLPKLRRRLKPIQVAISGIGGQGKTTLALHIIHHARIRRRYKGRRYFISCEALTSVIEVAERLLTEC